MPDLMEGQSRHRRCAQETQTKRFTQVALTETLRLIGQACDAAQAVFSHASPTRSGAADTMLVHG
jgi:hypothetical protein